MKKYKIVLSEDKFLGCDIDGWFEVIDDSEEEQFQWLFDEAEIVDYLTDINPKFKPTHEFVQNFIEVFGVEVEE